jgi:hypothetical protein
MAFFVPYSEAVEPIQAVPESSKPERLPGQARLHRRPFAALEKDEESFRRCRPWLSAASSRVPPKAAALPFTRFSKSAGKAESAGSDASPVEPM